jgi:hypothetical protein
LPQGQQRRPWASLSAGEQISNTILGITEYEWDNPEFDEDYIWSQMTAEPAGLPKY